MEGPKLRASSRLFAFLTPEDGKFALSVLAAVAIGYMVGVSARYEPFTGLAAAQLVAAAVNTVLLVVLLLFGLTTALQLAILVPRWREAWRASGVLFFRGRVLSVVLTLLLLSGGISLIAPATSAAQEFPPSSITMIRGTTTGSGNLGQIDGAVEIFSEVGTARSTTLTLLPDADDAVTGWVQGLAICSSDASHFNELDEDPHDSDVTCRREGISAGTNETRHTLQDATLPAGVINDVDVDASLTGLEVLPANGVLFASGSFNPAVGGCASWTLGTINQETYLTTTNRKELCGDGAGEWTAAALNALRTGTSCQWTQGIHTCRATQERAIVYVDYTDTHFLDFDVEFPGVPSDATGLSLRFSCTSTDEDKALAVTHLSISEGDLICDGTDRQLSLNDDSGVVTVSFASPTQTDPTPSTFSIDLLVVSATSTGGGEPPPGEDVLGLECFAKIKSIDCSVRILPPVPPGVFLVKSLFTGPGEQVRVERNATRHDASIPNFDLAPRNVTITVSVLLNDGSSWRSIAVVHVDRAWILAAILAAGFAIVMVYTWIYAGRAERATRKAKKNDYEAQYAERAAFFRRARR